MAAASAVHARLIVQALDVFAEMLSSACGDATGARRAVSRTGDALIAIVGDGATAAITGALIGLRLAALIGGVANLSQRAADAVTDDTTNAVTIGTGHPGRTARRTRPTAAIGTATLPGAIRDADARSLLALL